MKKLFTLALVFVFCFGSCVTSFAQNDLPLENNNTYIEVIFDKNSALSAEAKNYIENHFTHQDDIQTYGLSCTLFGHKYVTEYPTTITHRVRAEYPRCLEEDWEIVACSKCGHIKSEHVVSSTWVGCCH